MGMATVRAFALLALAIGLLAGILGVDMLAGPLASWPDTARGDVTVAPTETPPHRTVEVRDGLVVVDFRQCTRERVRVWVDFGSTTLAVAGRDGDVCLLDHGGEVENPTGMGDSRMRAASRRGSVSSPSRR